MRIVQTNLIHTNETIHTYYVWGSFHVKIHEWILSRFSLSRKNVQNIDWPIFQKCPCLFIVVRFSSTTSSLIHTQTQNSFIHRNFIHWMISWELLWMKIVSFYPATCLHYFKYKTYDLIKSHWNVSVKMIKFVVTDANQKLSI